jgi:hypothetical protein
VTKRTSIDEIQAGDEFRVVRGSRAGSLGVSGKIRVEALEGATAQVAVSVGKFGFNVDVQLELDRDGDEVAITASGSRFETIEMRAVVVAETSTEIRLQDVDGELADTHLVIDPDGTATLDAEIPKVGVLSFKVVA